MNMSAAAEFVDLSVVIPVGERSDDVEVVWQAYHAVLTATGRRFEFIYVLDGPHPSYAEALAGIRERGFPLHIAHLNRSFGETACLLEGVRRARADMLLFLPAYFQIAPEAISTLLDHAKSVDVATACRDRRRDHTLSRLRGWWFAMCARLAGSRFDDPGSAVRVVKRRVFDELQLHGEQHPFLPMLADQLGFTVEQVRLPQAEADRHFRAHSLMTYLGRLLDLIALGFLTRFMQKPFRFFGLLGAVFVICGLAIGIYMLIQRQTLGIVMADRPALLLTVMLIVLGIQIGAVGLIAEIIIFTRSPRRTMYQIDKVVAQSDDD
jgi:glycosyltransferase involved in cell wall biosynthesis